MSATESATTTMTEPFVPRRKMRRRKRKAEGEDISTLLSGGTHTLSELERKDRGPLCRLCGKRKPWGKLHTKYEVIKGTTFRLWICDDCGTVLRHDDMTDVQRNLDED